MDGEGLSMRRTELMQEVRKMRFEEAYEGLQRGRLTIHASLFSGLTVLADFHKNNAY